MAARKRWRGTTTQRGLGYTHVKRGQQARAAMRDGDRCWRCGEPMYHWQALDLDHVTPRALGGGAGDVRLAHAHCNRSAGAVLGNRMRGMRRAAVTAWHTSRQW